jgi:aminoglycoside phosphotransferase family enzyme
MKQNEIDQLAANGTHKGEKIGGQIVETHGAWVILNDKLAFKIKKPVKFSFLDFSTLEKRKNLCEQEVKLNSRLTDIYHGVEPVCEEDGQFSIGSDSGDVVDWTVKMDRLDSEREMKKMLQEDAVTRKHMEQLAEIMNRFHKKAEVVDENFNIDQLEEDFCDLKSIQSETEKELGSSYSSLIDSANEFARTFIRDNNSVFASRSKEGMIRDLHGDFHSGNIFLTDPPAIFDCIEFDDRLRQVDVLDELAFFCMDLEAHSKHDLSEHFLKSYFDRSPLEFGESEKSIFHFYKVYRANVRAKVSALNEDWKAARKFLDLIRELL